MTHYERLKVTQTSTKEEIKKSYRNLAKTYHPDKEGGCEETFKLINEAYTVLSDDNKRVQYDFTLQRNTFNSNQFNNFNSNFKGFNDIFRENLDIQRSIRVSFKEAFFGARIRVEIYSNESHEIFLPKGIKNGSKIRVEGKGEYSSKSGRTGDLLVTVMVTPDENIKQVDLLDIEMKVDIDIFQLFLPESKLEIKLWDQKVGNIKIAQGQDTSKKIRIKGKGIQNERFGASGDLFVKLNVITPKFDDLPETLVNEINKYIGGSNGN